MLISCLADFRLWRWREIRSLSETSVHIRTTRCYIPEDGNKLCFAPSESSMKSKLHGSAVFLRVVLYIYISTRTIRFTRTDCHTERDAAAVIIQVCNREVSRLNLAPVKATLLHISALINIPVLMHQPPTLTSHSMLLQPLQLNKAVQTATLATCIRR
jgi:hypothetical protein